VRAADEHPDRYVDAHGHIDAYQHADPDTHRHTNTDRQTNTDRHTNTDAHPHADVHPTGGPMRDVARVLRRGVPKRAVCSARACGVRVWTDGLDRPALGRWHLATGAASHAGTRLAPPRSGLSGSTITNEAPLFG